MTGESAKANAKRAGGGVGPLAGLAWLLLLLVAPVALLVATATNVLLRRRWPDRAVAWLLAAAGAAGALVLLVLIDYPAAWARLLLGWWHLPPAEDWPPELRHGAQLLPVWPAGPSWRDAVVVASAGLACGLLLGALWWRLAQRTREAHPYDGHDEREARLTAEARRRRRVTEAAQRARIGSDHAAVRAVVRPLAVPLGGAVGPFLGRYLRGDLGGPERTVHRRKSDQLWRAGPLVRLPLGTSAVRHVVILGATGLGKTETTLRMCEWAMRQGWQAVYLSAKEPPRPEEAAAPRLTALAESLGKTSRVLLGHGIEPFDPMRGTADQVRDKFVAVEEWREDYWQHCANLLLHIVLQLRAAQGADVRDLPDLLRSLTKAQFRQLASMAGPEVEELAQAVGSDSQLAGVLTRYGSMAVHLRGWIGSAGGWSWEDADVCVAELPTSTQRQAGQRLLRLLVRDFAQYVTDPLRRADPSRPVLLVIEEAGQVAGDPILGPEFVSLVERGRTAGVRAVLTAQGPSGFGDESTRAALLTNGVVLTYRQTAEAEQLADLAGSRRVDEGSLTYDGSGMGTGGSTRRQYAFKLNPQQLRVMPAGEFALIAGGGYCTAAAVMSDSGYRPPQSARAAALVQLMRAPDHLLADTEPASSSRVKPPATDHGGPPWWRDRIVPPQLEEGPAVERDRTVPTWRQERDR